MMDEAKVDVLVFRGPVSQRTQDAGCPNLLG